MFTHMTNLAHTRSFTEAFGFFVFYTMLLVGLSTFVGHYAGTFNLMEGTGGSFFEGGNWHTMVGAGWVLFLSTAILQGRKLTNDLMSVAIALLGVYMAYTVDVLVGMAVVSYLTTTGK